MIPNSVSPLNILNPVCKQSPLYIISQISSFIQCTWFSAKAWTSLYRIPAIAHAAFLYKVNIANSLIQK